MLAPAVLLLSVMLLPACFNPFFIGAEQPRQNHVPVVEVFPAPSNVPIAVNVGGGCDSSLEVISLEDADGDPLQARYDLVRTVGGNQKRTNIALSPILEPDGDGLYVNTASASLELGSANLGGFSFEDELQLIELRISDSGFDTDANKVPIAANGGGLFFISWIIAVGDCPTPVVTP